MARVLTKTITFPDGARVGIYPPGTAWEEIDEAHREALDRPSLWIDDSALDVDDRLTLLDVPQGLDEMDEAQLRQVAEHHGVGLGRLKDPDKIRRVLREHGIGEDEI